MTGHRQYKITDFRFGLEVARLREKVKLTQKETAEVLNVSRRTIQHWEAGTAFPDTNHLKNLVAFFLSYGAFAQGHEKEEVRSLWEQADESALRRKTPFDETWLDHLLHEISKAKNEKGASKEDRWPAFSTIDWHDAPDVREIYGREPELAELSNWVIDQNVRFVVVLGMGGIGKTTLSTKFAQAVSSQFEYVIWRSLQNAPPLEELLLQCLQILSPVNTSKPTVNQLLELMQAHRCLLILDNMETLHKTGTLSGEYRDGYKEYENLFLQLAKTWHKSCVLLTSREIPRELEPLEGEQTSVRVMRVTGLTWEASQSLLNDKGLFGPAESWEVFVHYYAGNPLALKIAANTIRELFGGDLAAFLKEAPVTLHTLLQLLDNQFDHLSPLEQEIMYWLAIEREPISLDQLRENIFGRVFRNALLAGLLSLRQRSLIERGEAGAVFNLQPVLLEFVTNRFVTYVSEELLNQDVRLITHYTLMKSKTREYIRESQVRMILMPVLAHLKDTLGSNERLTAHLRAMVQSLRNEPIEGHGFAGGNLVNLLTFLNGHIRGEDFSNLLLRQVYLQGMEAQDSNFSAVEFIDPHFTEPIETIGAMTLSPKGKYLAAGSYSGQIHMWLAEDIRPLWTVSGAQREWTMAFSQDETMLASGGFNGEICIWNSSNGRLLNKVAGHRVWVYAVAFQSDGRRLASGGYYGSVRIWNTEDLSLEMVLEGHTSSISSLAFTPDDAFLVTSSRDGAIRIWDLANGNCLHTLHHSDTSAWIRTSVHPNGRWLASGSEEDPYVKFWDIQTGECLTTIDTHSLGSDSMAFDLEGEIFARGNSEGGIGLWRVNPILAPQYLGILIGHQHYIEPVSFARKGMLATLSYGEGIKLWDTRSGKLLTSIQGYSRLIGTTAFSADGKLLIQGDANGRIRIWDLVNKRYMSNFQAHTGPIWKITVSSDGKKFASCADDRLIKLWDLKELRCLKTFIGHSGRIFTLTSSSDGTMLASGSTDRLINLWSADNDNNVNAIQSLERLFDQVWSLAFDPTGRILASGHNDGEIHLWTIETGNHLRVMHHEANLWGDLVGALRFSSDGKYLFSSSANELLRRWDISTGDCIVTSRRVIGNRNNAIAIGRDGKFVITGSKEPDVFFWRIEEAGIASEPLQLSGHTSRVWTVAISPDENLLASSDEEGTTILWDLQSKTLLYKIAIDRPYERMNIQGATGLNLAEREALKVLGASDQE
jgi:WD40 repeat protein/transcriptional regulator with XRE-family HTH domain